jgi:hypothetical protein
MSEHDQTLPKEGPDLCAPPHVLPALVDLFVGEKQQALAQQDGLLTHVVACHYCRTATIILLSAAEEADRLSTGSGEEAHALLVRLADLERKVTGLYERLGVYAETMVTKGRGEAAALFPTLAEHLSTCVACRAMLEETLEFLLSENEPSA